MVVERVEYDRGTSPAIRGTSKASMGNVPGVASARDPGRDAMTFKTLDDLPEDLTGKRCSSASI